MYKLDEKYKLNIQNSVIPERITSSLIRYIEYGISPGDFLTGVLENDLSRACSHADEEMKHLLWELYIVIYNYVPYTCHGSKEAVKRWKDNFDENRNWKGRLLIQEEDDESKLVGDPDYRDDSLPFISRNQRILDKN